MIAIIQRPERPDFESINSLPFRVLGVRLARTRGTPIDSAARGFVVIATAGQPAKGRSSLHPSRSSSFEGPKQLKRAVDDEIGARIDKLVGFPESPGYADRPCSRIGAGFDIDRGVTDEHGLLG